AAVQESSASDDGDLSYMLENLEECRVLALTQARLLPEARTAAMAYIELCSRTGRRDSASPRTVELVTVALMSANPAAAAGYATASAKSYAARGKPVDAALARVALLRAQLSGGDVRASTLRRGLAAANVLDQAGWRND